MVNMSLKALSLLAPSPPTLPQVPTLAELQKHAQDLLELGTPPLAPLQTRKSSWYIWSSPPPKYSEADPETLLKENRADLSSTSGVLTVGHTARAKCRNDQGKIDNGRLKKGRKWYQVQGGIPDEVSVQEIVKPSMGRSKAYAKSIGECPASSRCRSRNALVNFRKLIFLVQVQPGVDERTKENDRGRCRHW